MGKVLLLGEALIDFLSDHYSEKLEDVKGFIKHAGGSPANITANLLNLGEEGVLITRIGNDPFGDYLFQTFVERGIDTSHVQIDNEHHTSLVFVAKSRGNPKFFPLRSADIFIEKPREISKLLEDVSFFHISAWSISHNSSRNTVFSILEDIQKHDIQLCFDPNYREILWGEDDDAFFVISKVLQQTYLCKPSDDDAFHIFGKMKNEEYINEFHRLGAKNVILTMGKDGALISDGKKIRHQDPLSTVVVDTTGAGDGFWSGVYCALSRGEDIFTAARWGSAVAAFRLKSPGSDLALPPIEVIKSEYLM